jgi:hypothetical protein
VDQRGHGTRYQWQRDGVDVPHANGPDFEIASVDESVAATYVCIVSSEGGSSRTVPTAVTVKPTKPRVVRQAEDTMVDYNQSATLSVDGEGLRHASVSLLDAA